LRAMNLLRHKASAGIYTYILVDAAAAAAVVVVTAGSIQLPSRDSCFSLIKPRRQRKIVVIWQVMDGVQGEAA